MNYHVMESPIGPLTLVGDGKGLSDILFSENGEPAIVSGKEDASLFSDVIGQLKAYFSGDLKEFDVKLQLKGTEFQNQVWTELQKIPYGATISYGELAERINNPKSVRAVGAANGKNHIPIIIPCHRVIGKNGKLVGFAGGLDTKAFLLDLELDSRQGSFESIICPSIP